MDCINARSVAGAVVPDNLFIRPVRQRLLPLRALLLSDHHTGIALDGARGNMIIFDSGNSRLQVLNYFTGAHVSSHGSKGSLPGQFSGIGSISFDRKIEHLYVADGDNHRVQVRAPRIPPLYFCNNLSRYCVTKTLHACVLSARTALVPANSFDPTVRRLQASSRNLSRRVPSHLGFLWSQALHSTEASTWWLSNTDLTGFTSCSRLMAHTYACAAGKAAATATSGTRLEA